MPVRFAKDVRTYTRRKSEKLSLDVRDVVLPLKKTFVCVLYVFKIFIREFNFLPKD